jgi:hypothetical protein
MEAARNDPETAKMMQLMEEMASSGPIQEATHEAGKKERIDLSKLKEYLKETGKCDVNKETPKPLFSEEQRRGIIQQGKAAQAEIDRIEEEKRKAEEERRRREEEDKRRREAEERRRREEQKKRKEEEQKRREQLEEMLKHTANRTFANNQEARRFFEAHRPRNPHGWLCNAYNNVHNNPSECAEPERGGRWLFD